jgi:regulator of protease activity HflC (stomatin/prohibitin superfamily)
VAIITVREFERAVRLVNGRVRGVLEPGRHRYRRSRTEVWTVDLRPQLVPIPGQDVLTADGVTVRVTTVLRMTVTDPVPYLTASRDAHAEIYAAGQQALRTVVSGVALEALLDARTTIGAEMLPLVQPAGVRVGVEVSEVSVRDVMLPAELKRAFAQQALAREQGKAELERARAEAATLRSLANTAKLLEEHPALLRLRTLQVAEQDGTEVRLTMTG